MDHNKRWNRVFDDGLAASAARSAIADIRIQQFIPLNLHGIATPESLAAEERLKRIEDYLQNRFDIAMTFCGILTDEARLAA